MIARNSSSPQFDIIKNAERNSIDCQVQLCVIKANWVFMMGQNNSSQYNSRRWPEIFSQLTSHISSFLSFQSSNNKRYHRCKCLKKVLRMENRQLKFKTNNPVGKQYHQQLEGTSSPDTKLSVLSWSEMRDKVFGRSKFKIISVTISSPGKATTDSCDAFHYFYFQIILLLIQRFFMEEAGRWIATIIFQYFSEVAKIHVISEWVSQSSNIRKWRENVKAIFRLGGNVGV